LLCKEDAGERDMTSGHQWSSVFISVHQRSSAVISGHQRSSVAISGHQWSSVVNSGHQVIRDHQGSSDQQWHLPCGARAPRCKGPRTPSMRWSLPVKGDIGECEVIRGH
jgi:hypothetical protein